MVATREADVTVGDVGVRSGLSGVGGGRYWSGWRGRWSWLYRWARRHPTAFDVVLAAALLPVSLDGVGRVAPGSVGYALVVSGVLTLALALRRRFPLGVLSVGWATGLAFEALGWHVRSVGAVSVVVLVATYTVGAYAGRRRAMAALGWIGIYVGAALVTSGLPLWMVLTKMMALSACVVAALLLGLYVGARRDFLASLRERAERAERERDQQSRLAVARERSRIAREMHDIIAHNLSVMIALADGAAFATAHSPAQARSATEHVSSIGRQALREMRRLLGVLRSDTTSHTTSHTTSDTTSDTGGETGGETASGGEAGGAEAALMPQPGIAQIDELVAQMRAVGLPTTLTVAGEPFELTPTAQLAVYRVVQEALTNVVTHAVTPCEARIVLTYTDPTVTLEIVDDGAGTPPARSDTRSNTDAAVGRGPGHRPGERPGHGLSGMAERVALFGGYLDAGPRPGGQGWRVMARLAPGHVPADTSEEQRT